MAKSKGVKPLVQNRRARHDYFVEETYECGMELKGTEVKSIRQGRANLKEAYARVRDGEVFVDGMHISPYEQGSIYNADPLRPKRLLLHKSEIRKLQNQVSRQGYTLIPLQLYLKNGLVKLELGVCRGKQLHDKRDAVAEADALRDIERAMRQGRKSYRED
ncbi:MAG TPA: SsrA-binding protein SmpB [Clostridia bacterium]|jgi:SsrA-binding protein|nr:SsrA-binding protein SmpB [Clostridia bacterium]HPY43377.1 SsrA-binding protein SmpB [Clostridia bacterium]HQA96950.1 SsrA-binding protein SmpB [Clostridia bacterium]HQO55886.1 SsrA-binding protein SmpB [Clostridia bacterium]HUM60150.1 SsrA-binding protein SmpB [Clostridia bacterium]